MAVMTETELLALIQGPAVPLAVVQATDTRDAADRAEARRIIERINLERDVRASGDIALLADLPNLFPELY